VAIFIYFIGNFKNQRGLNISKCVCKSKNSENFAWKRKIRVEQSISPAANHNAFDISSTVLQSKISEKNVAILFKLFLF